MSNKDFGASKPFKRSKVDYYYDYHLTRKDLLTGYSYPNYNLYALLDQLNWFYQEEGWLVVPNLNIYQTDDPTEESLSPELALFKDFVLPQQYKDEIVCWPLTTGLPAPTVVIEFTHRAEWQWQNTVEEKSEMYRQMGVKELYAYDGLETWSRKNLSVRGWRCGLETRSLR